MATKNDEDPSQSRRPTDTWDTRLATLAEHVVEMVSAQDPSGRFTHANEAMHRQLGYSPPDLLGRNAFEFFHPDDVSAARARFHDSLNGSPAEARRRTFEYRFRHGDGSWRWLESVAIGAPGDIEGPCVIVHSRDITRRKEDERAVSLNHARYRAVADLSDGAVYEYLMDAAGEYQLEWCFGTQRVYGCDEAEFRRRGWRSFMVGAGWNDLSRARTARYLSGETVEFTSQIQRADGVLRWIEVRNRPIADPSTGRFVRLVGVALDITERKQAADALRESEFRYRTVAELTSGFVYEATVDGRGEAHVVWASPGFTEFFGGDFEQLNRLGWRSVLNPADHSAAVERRHRLRRGERAEVELAVRTMRGEQRWIHLANQPLIAADGSITRYIGVVHDITDRKANEEVLRSQALAVEVMHEGVVLSDRCGIIRMTNPAFDRMFAAVSGSLLGKHLDQLPCEPPLARRIAELIDEEIVRPGAPALCELTLRVAHEGEATLSVEAAITPLILRGERFWLTILQDTTARRQLEREVLEVANREQQRIGNDLHDGLGQELTGIALLLRGLENRAEREAPALSSAIEEVALLVNDAIFTTRALARGLSPVTFDRGGLSNALDSLAQRLSAMFHIDVRCSADASLDAGLESANALHLYRIAQEAVTNAAQHGHAGKVRITLGVDGDRGVLRVEDDGGGFDPASLEGKGLGLRIMRYRAQMMTGSLRIESTRQRGTTVSCWFPATIP